MLLLHILAVWYYFKYELLKMDFSSESSNNNHDSALDLFEKPVFCENFQSQTDIIIQPTGGEKNLSM